ncbi:MAG TPA: rhodanese-like domain-containing protein [Trichocoleus sp.]
MIASIKPLLLRTLTHPWRALVWRYLKAKIRKQFPTAEPISTQELADWLRQKNRPQPVLLDVRRAEEFAVSHLPQAQAISTVEEVLKAGLTPDSPLVTYCSIGYRSARLAAQLQAAGFTQVYNLEGSIFQWFNEGRQVVTNGEPTDRVHPYSKAWGLLLEPHTLLKRDQPQLQ